MKEPIFRSELGPGMQSFIEMRKSLGYEVRTLTAYLSHFDRYAIAIGYGDSWLSRSLVEGWIASTPLLKPSSRAHRLYVMRKMQAESLAELILMEQKLEISTKG